MNEKPAVMPIEHENIPEELKVIPSWVAWKWVWDKKHQRWTKPPYDVKSGNRAKSNDSKTWATYEAACAALPKYDGLGFMFPENCGLVGLDWDNARNPETGEPRDWVRPYLENFSSYTEISPSSTGFKSLVRGTIPKNHHNDKVGAFSKTRFFCITGQSNGFRDTIEPRQAQLDALFRELWSEDLEPKKEAVTAACDDDTAIIDKMLSAKNATEILGLLNGEWKDKYPSQSEADAALCSHIAFYTQDREQIDRIFRKSGLYREKWDREDYRKRTIEKALSGGKETYQGKQQTSRNSSSGAPTMADLREYIDLCVVPGQKISVDEICKGLSCYKRDERKAVYTYIGRLCNEGLLKKDEYRHGGYRRTITLNAYDLAGDILEDEIFFDIELPLDLSGLIQMKPNQLFQVSGRYDAGKSSFLFQIEADNYQDNKIVHIVSEEWSVPAIKERMDILGIPRPHKNISVIPMKPGYEDAIPAGPCIVLIDYIRADQNPFETDAQIQRILRNLNGGIAVFATQKHPGLDRPVGGQFAVHASHHIVLLDRWKSLFTCKIYRTKNERNLEGYYKTFRLTRDKRLEPCMDTWKQGQIKWEKDPIANDNSDNKDNRNDVVNRGGPPVRKEKEKERAKEKERENPSATAEEIPQTGLEV